MTLLFLIKLTLLLGMGTTLLCFLRSMGAAMRNLVCVFTLSAAMVLPWIPGLQMGAMPALSNGLAISVSAKVAADGGHTFSFIGWLWLAGALVVVARFVSGAYYMARVTRDSVPMEQHDGVEIRAADVMSPVLWGWLRPVILVPLDFEDWSAERRQAALLHEIAHLRQGDNWCLLLTLAAKAIYWFHPLVWWLGGEAEKAREVACDESVLGRGINPSDYAGLLVELAGRTSANMPAACGIADNRGLLRRRVENILAFRGCNQARVRDRFAVGLCASLVVCAGILLPTSCERAERMGTVYRVGEQGVISPILTSKVEPKYTDEARQKKIQGTVILGVIVDRDGRAKQIRIQRSLDPGLDQKAKEAIGEWKFTPGKKNGEAVATQATIEVQFRLL
jgi:TonB family protein